MPHLSNTRKCWATQESGPHSFREFSDQSARVYSLIRAFSALWYHPTYILSVSGQRRTWSDWVCASGHSMSSYVIGAIFIFRAWNTSWISNELIWRFLKNSQYQSVSTPCDVWITSVRNAQTDHKSEGMICSCLFDLCSKANFSWRGQVLEGFPMVLFRISTQELMCPTWNFWNMNLLYLL